MYCKGAINPDLVLKISETVKEQFSSTSKNESFHQGPACGFLDQYFRISAVVHELGGVHLRLGGDEIENSAEMKSNSAEIK